LMVRLFEFIKAKIKSYRHGRQVYKVVDDEDDDLDDVQDIGRQMDGIHDVHADASEEDDDNGSEEVLQEAGGQHEVLDGAVNGDMHAEQPDYV